MTLAGDGAIIAAIDEWTLRLRGSAVYSRGPPVSSSSELQELVLERLTRHEAAAPGEHKWCDYVFAALLGDEALTASLDGSIPIRPPAKPVRTIRVEQAGEGISVAPWSDGMKTWCTSLRQVLYLTGLRAGETLR